MFPFIFFLIIFIHSAGTEVMDKNIAFRKFTVMFNDIPKVVLYISITEDTDKTGGREMGSTVKTI